MSMLGPKTVNMFYFNGNKHTTPTLSPILLFIVHNTAGDEYVGPQDGQYVLVYL